MGEWVREGGSGKVRCSAARRVLLLVGERDEAFLAATDYMAAKIPNATKVIIPGAGHAANIEQPLAFNQAVGAFLSALP